MPANTSNGRSTQTRTKTNTIVPKSAEQAMLMKQDEIIDRINAVVNALEGAADIAAVNAAAAAMADIVKVKLVR